MNGSRFYLEDNLSKFGTLVLIRQRTPLIPGYNKAVQIGRTVINFSVKAMAGSGSSGAQAQLIKDDNFGPRPVHGLIKGKIEEADQILMQAHRNKVMSGGAIDNEEDDNSGEDVGKMNSPGDMREGMVDNDEDMAMDDFGGQQMF